MTAMVSSSCWKCLSKPSIQLTAPSLYKASTRVPTAVAFSTSSSLLALPPKKTKVNPSTQKREQAAKQKGARSLRIKKKVPVKTGRPPAAGERKALRKRIVLSNTNALEVQGLQDLDKELLLEDGLVGKVVGLKGTTVDQLRASEAFKTTQGWGLFRRPGVLVREESLEISQALVDAEERKQALRLVVDGDKGTGKSLLMIHAMATAFIREWIVLNIPEAQELTNAVTEYAPIPGTTPTLYSQNTYIAALLGRIGKANDAILQNLELSQKHSLPIPLQSSISLARLCELGARDPDVSWPVFQAFWKEITSEGRPPILMCLDSLSHIMQNSLYRNAEFQLIHAHDLAIVNHFVQHLSGEKKLPNGGAIIAATSRSHAPISLSMNLAIQQAMDRATEEEITEKDPYEKRYDERADKVLRDVEVMQLQGLSKVEARGLMEYWAASGVLRTAVNERTVAEKWALAGNGIVGEIERGALRMRI